MSFGLFPKISTTVENIVEKPTRSARCAVFPRFSGQVRRFLPFFRLGWTMRLTAPCSDCPRLPLHRRVSLDFNPNNQS